MNITGTVAVVTGAGAGIGRATALALARAGAGAVVVVDVDEEAGRQVAVELEALGTDAWFSATDVSDPSAQEALFSRIEQRHGGVDILHNNAGVMSGEPIWPDTPIERLARTIGVNFAGVVFGTRCAIETMRNRGGGAIVNTASRAALSTGPFDPLYHATKAAVVNFTQSCRFLAEQAGIRVNAVLPGVVDTKLLATTGAGGRMASWLEPIVSRTEVLDATTIADAVVGLVRDDTQAGTCLVIDNPPAPPVRLGDWAALFR